MNAEFIAEITRLVEERHPREGRNAAQTLRLGLIKLLEEAVEAAETVALPKELSAPLDELTWAARRAFREREWLDTPDRWAERRPPERLLAELRAELADTYIVLAHLVGLVEELTGEPFDIEGLARAKASRDRARA